MPFEEARARILQSNLGFDECSLSQNFCLSWLVGQESLRRDEREEATLAIAQEANEFAREANAIARDSNSIARSASTAAFRASRAAIYAAIIAIIGIMYSNQEQIFEIIFSILNYLQ